MIFYLFRCTYTHINQRDKKTELGCIFLSNTMMPSSEKKTFSESTDCIFLHPYKYICFILCVCVCCCFVCH